MKATEQGVLQVDRLTRLFSRALLLLTFCLSTYASAETASNDTTLIDKTNSRQHRVAIIYSADSKLQSTIAKEIFKALDNHPANIDISITSTDKKKITPNKKNDIVIAIGNNAIKDVMLHYPNTNKLLITSKQKQIREDGNTDNNNAVLYMTQPYCRQIQFIKAINNNWKTIGILNSQNKTIDTKTLQQCANKHKIKINITNITNQKNLTSHLKIALNQSNLLLALPDTNIYNSRSVKNILLTSYRYRKPVIAFSKSFVNAGALASIHSDATQIAETASKLIEKYFNHGKEFKTRSNYPKLFNISINKQVFRALDISEPDIDKLKQTLELEERELSEAAQ